LGGAVTSLRRATVCSPRGDNHDRSTTDLDKAGTASAERPPTRRVATEFEAPPRRPPHALRRGGRGCRRPATAKTSSSQAAGVHVEARRDFTASAKLAPGRSGATRARQRPPVGGIHGYGATALLLAPSRQAHELPLRGGGEDARRIERLAGAPLDQPRHARRDRRRPARHRRRRLPPPPHICAGHRVGGTVPTSLDAQSKRRSGQDRESTCPQCKKPRGRVPLARAHDNRPDLLESAVRAAREGMARSSFVRRHASDEPLGSSPTMSSSALRRPSSPPLPAATSTDRGRSTHCEPRPTRRARVGPTPAKRRQPRQAVPRTSSPPFASPDATRVRLEEILGRSPVRVDRDRAWAGLKRDTKNAAARSGASSSGRRWRRARSRRSAEDARRASTS